MRQRLHDIRLRVPQSWLQRCLMVRVHNAGTQTSKFGSSPTPGRQAQNSPATQPDHSVHVFDYIQPQKEGSTGDAENAMAPGASAATAAAVDALLQHLAGWKACSTAAGMCSSTTSIKVGGGHVRGVNADGQPCCKLADALIHCCGICH